jgi:hypothetical protein
VGELQKLVLENAYYMPGLWWMAQRRAPGQGEELRGPAEPFTNQKLQDVWLSEDEPVLGATVRTYVTKRLLLIVPTLFGVAAVVFVIMRVIPGDVTLPDPGRRPDRAHRSAAARGDAAPARTGPA